MGDYTNQSTSLLAVLHSSDRKRQYGNI